MNREIKFRAWNGKHKEMRVVDAMLRSGEVMCGEDAFKPDALMQYTGLKDKNGKEIYEGDILSIRDGKPKQVKWSDDIRNCGECSEVQATGFDLEEFCNSNEREVIGNIYENPDLLSPN